ncbi:MAG: thioredoxin domain-containing protein [Proteobacteria bacterium]|nr:thioredoxin domain-containing protein [Pseudomonadota bacterium]
MAGSLRVFAAAATAAFALACSTGSSAPDVAADDDSPVVAEVAGRSITQAEVDREIKDQLFEREFTSRGAMDQYEQREAALQELIGAAVLTAAASERGVSEAELIEAEVEGLGPVTDDEVKEFYERHQTRMRGATLDATREQIRGFLQRDRPNQVLTALREKADVAISLEPPRFEVAASGPGIGPEGAPVTIVEFSDYQCPFCKRAEPVVKQVLERYPDQVRLVFRHMPLDSIHPLARGAAEASACADEQGRFWEFHDHLFQNQRALKPEDLERYAGETGLDVPEWKACMDEGRTKQLVADDVAAARLLDVRGTPAFFVNGIPLSGAKPLEDFVRVIDRELASAADTTDNNDES